MFRKVDVTRYCKDFTKIENYSKALCDTHNVWVIHHKRENLYYKSGRWIERDVWLTKQQLIEMGQYYNVSPDELIFMERTEHRRLHMNHQNIMDLPGVREKQKNGCMGTRANSRMVQCVETGQVYDSVAQAEKSLNGKQTGNIHNVLRGKHKTAFGYHWVYYLPCETQD